MGIVGALFLACLKIALQNAVLHYAQGQLLWGPRPSLAWSREQGAEFRDLLH